MTKKYFSVSSPLHNITHISSSRKLLGNGAFMLPRQSFLISITTYGRDAEEEEEVVVSILFVCLIT